MKTLLALLIIVIALSTGMNRATFVGVMVSAYEKENGTIIVSNCPFVDVAEYPAACKAYEVGITAGTTAYTFSPELTVEPYQAFLFVGKTMMLMDK